MNDAPTLNSVGDLVLDESAGLQTVNLTGISAGPTNESQTITITATSDNISLVPNPTVNYASPDSTGTLTFTPVTNAFGTATVTVVVQDDGGTANGGVDAITNTFTVTVNAITNLWLPDGSFTVDVNDATGLPGTGYTQTNYTGVLDLQATATNPFTIRLVSLDGTSPGPAANFDYHNTNTWTIATTTRGVMGFDSAKFVVNDSQFSNDLAGGTFAVTLSGDGLSVNVVFLPNHAPVAGVATYGRAWGTALRIPVLHLLTNFTGDADGDGRGLVVIGVSTNGAWISTNTTYILFAPANNMPETFNYVICDLRNYRSGDTVQMATNSLTVSVTNAVGRAQTISVSGPNVKVRFAGVPGYAYDVERTTNVTAGTWVVLLTTNAPAHGVWEYLDTNPPLPGAFYRTKQH